MALDCREESLDGVLVLRVRGEWIDIETAVALGRLLNQRLQEQPGISLLLDISAVTEICSAFLATLVQAERECKARQGYMALSSVRAEVLKVFEATHLTQVLRIFPSQVEALKHLQGVRKPS
ncbi:MAG: STAS domain-containing protein [Candidatus Riflebacteria bacterium]|nr:STAS domain-containing protein [Candidatus Riflebacteria bacterium]